MQSILIEKNKNLKSTKRIFFLCPDENVPIGGVKKIYNQVDILNKNGFQAFVLHTKKDFKCNWFKHSTPVVYPSWSITAKLNFFWKKIKNKFRHTTAIPFFSRDLPLILNGKKIKSINSNDILVLPEIWAFAFYEAIATQPFVIFNQNAYQTFNSIKLPQSSFDCDKSLMKTNPYKAPALLGVIVVSENNFEFLTTTFSPLPVYRLRISVDITNFNFSCVKSKNIAYMPRRNLDDILQVIAILNERGNLNGWSFIPINNLKEEKVGLILKSCWIFLSFSHQEGFALPPLEAILCGCRVIGYHGEGGKEYVKYPQIPIPAHDIIEFVKAIELFVAEIQLNPEKILELNRQNAENIKMLYSPQIEEEDTIFIWNKILNNQRNT